MFHLLVKFDGWASARDLMPQGRVFEYTHEMIVEQFKPGGTLDVDRIRNLPALFVSETNSTGDQRARIGGIVDARIATNDISLEYSFYDGIPPIPNSTLEQLSGELDIKAWEFSRTHWAIKNIDLLKVLLGTHVRTLAFPNVAPKVFTLESGEGIDNRLLSVMMPFDTRFDGVYGTIQTVAKGMKMKCLRADDIWKYDAIIQDIVSLISRSRIIVCDCTGRNPNVFYEAGIAHTLGRDVILITQSETDIPFDLRHLRYVVYLNNGEGREQLAERLRRRIKTLLGQIFE
jgi:hypothetical protein